MSEKLCKLDGCGAPYLAKGYCKRHYGQWQRGAPVTLDRGGEQYTEEVTTCGADECENSFRQRKWGSKRLYCSRRCSDRTMKQRLRAAPSWEPPHRRSGQPACRIAGCDLPRYAREMCSMHYGRDVKYGDPGEAAYRKAPRNQSEWKVNSDGYVVRSTNRGKQLQHRVVMEGILGRALLPLETVHHKNGVRSDNDPSNLELWSKAQPAGQRVEDKITWAIEFLSQYGYGVTIPPP